MNHFFIKLLLVYYYSKRLQPTLVARKNTWVYSNCQCAMEWWYMSAIPELMSPRQEGCELEAALYYTA